MPAPKLTEVQKSFGEKVGVAISSALTAASNSAWQLQVVDGPSNDRPVNPDAACYRFNFEGSLVGEAFLLLNHDDLAMLAIGQSGAAVTGSREAQLSALQTALQGSIAQLERLLSENGPVLISIELLEEFKVPDGLVIEFSARCEGTVEQVPLSYVLSERLEAGLLASSAKPFAFSSATDSTAANLDLVLDVELNVTLRFGQRQLALREVLDLTSGSVVELDRQVDEPVELVLDGRVVARGEAVIIDGNYGIRVTQVIQPIEI